MKKINLKSLLTQEVLSKDELKKVVGGAFGSWPGGCTQWLCWCPGSGTWREETCDPGEENALWDAIQASCPWGGGCSPM